MGLDSLILAIEWCIHRSIPLGLAHMASLLLHFSSLGIDLPPLRFGVPTRLQNGVCDEERGEGKFVRYKAAKQIF